jgi:flagellar motor protein MotB
LSSSRATEVVEFLNNKLGLDPAGGKLYAAGYSEFSPKVENYSDDAKALNRRIEMIIEYEERKK